MLHSTLRVSGHRCQRGGRHVLMCCLCQRSSGAASRGRPHHRLSGGATKGAVLPGRRRRRRRQRRQGQRSMSRCKVVNRGRSKVAVHRYLPVFKVIIKWQWIDVVQRLSRAQPDKGKDRSIDRLGGRGMAHCQPYLCRPETSQKPNVRCKGRAMPRDAKLGLRCNGSCSRAHLPVDHEVREHTAWDHAWLV